MKRVVAAYCHRGQGAHHQFVLVTSSTGRWIPPKGHRESWGRGRDVAQLEAWEEAGIHGVVGKAKSFRIKRGGWALWKFYPIEIRGMAQEWPESKSRERRLVNLEEAKKLVDSPMLYLALEALAKSFEKA